ncbi:ABC transporter permease [Lacticaseibacillus zhaodongensis]|uniref:ABC transporter permease n=1 Tax=Lacticaseibacillus zhaodongensis TaxID=2668065 RepID=UPI0012D2FCF4|nr:ABC transporter permease [Lacticaseibacillus zhaodongensis]
MIKRSIIIDILVALLAVLAGLVWSQGDQSEYADMLSNGGMSDQALVYHSQSSESLQKTLQKLDASKKMQNYQVQFTISKHVSYFFAKGSYRSLPLQNGHFFSADDFHSSLPVAVVGSNVAKRLYLTANQKYLHRNGRYINVIGTVGTQQGNALNDHEFISASTESDNGGLRQKDVTIMVDGADIIHTTTLSRIFGGAHGRRLIYSGTTHPRSWLQRNGGALLALIVITLAMAGAGLLSAIMTPQLQVKGLEAPLRNNYLRGVGSQFLPGVAIAIVVGTGIAWWRFYITDHFRLVLFAAFLMVIFALSNQLFMFVRSNNRRNQRAAS